MNLIRTILLEIETSKVPYVHFDGEEALHVALLDDAGFVEANFIRADSEGIIRAIVSRLKWQGHDFLDAMRDETIWKKAQDSVLKPAGGVAFDVLLEWLKYQMREKLGLTGSA